MDSRETVSERFADARTAQVRTRLRLERAAVVQRTSPQSRGERILSLALRRCGGAHHGRCRRVDHHLGGDRAWARSANPERAALPAFARSALFGLHLL